MSELGEWDSFYLIVGGAAGALIGLQFVVMTLIAERPSPMIAVAGPLFSTPTIIHFSATLLVSAVLRAPWPGVRAAAFACSPVGLCGLIYTLLVAGASGYKVPTSRTPRTGRFTSFCHCWPMRC